MKVNKFKKYIFVGFLLLTSCVISAQIDYAKLKGAKAKAVLMKEFPFVNAYDYSFNSPNKDSLLVKVINENSPEALLSKKFSSQLASNREDSIVFSIKLITRLIVEIDGKKHYFISYKPSNYKKKTLDIIEEKAIYIENTISTKETELFKSILLNANAYMLFKFNNKRNDKSYQIINELKSKVKNDQGIIDVKLLATVLEENKSKLKSYLEN